MAKSNSILENANLNVAELFILDTLLKGENVIIPDFGHLELKTLGERRTVLFKSTDNNDSFLRIVPATVDEKEKTLYTSISVPLKEGKVVNLPQVGIFTPKKRANGEIYASFMLSSSLRKLLNKEEETQVEEEANKESGEIKETLNIQENKDEAKKDEGIIDGAGEAEKGNNGKPERVSLLPNNNSNISSKIRNKSPLPPKKPQVVEMEEGASKAGSRSISGILLAVVAILFVVVIVVSTIHSRHTKKMEEQPASVILSDANTTASESVDLTTLAEQHYGNSVFWVYIYEANLDKLNSPINIPKNVSLVIPDLKTDYDVDVTDSMEIQRANILSDMILKKEKNNNK